MLEATWGGDTLDETKSPQGSTVSLFPKSGGSLRPVHASLEPSVLAQTPDFGRKLNICGSVNARVEERFARVNEQELLLPGSGSPINRNLAEHKPFRF